MALSSVKQEAVYLQSEVGLPEVVKVNGMSISDPCGGIIHRSLGNSFHQDASSISSSVGFGVGVRGGVGIGMGDGVVVTVRIRPSNDEEGGNKTSIHTLPDQPNSLVTVSSIDTIESASTVSTAATYGSTSDCSTVQVSGPESNQTFTFDHVFGPSTDQVDVFSTCITPLIQSCIEGYNATILAYGQTGSGKTHTMIGDISQGSDSEEVGRGVIPRALQAIFLELESTEAECRQEAEEGDEVAEIHRQHSSSESSRKPPFEYQVKVQFLELYGEHIHDLIITEMNTDGDGNGIGKDKSPKRQSSSTSLSTSLHSIRSSSSRPKKSPTGRVPLELLDGKKGEDAEVVGICQVVVKSAEEALQYLTQGMNRRCTKKTAMNAASSRSHAIFTVVMEQTRRSGGIDGDSVSMKSKIHFVDLAGSERIKRTHTEGKRMREGISINKGLLTLGNVISLLGSPKKHNKGHAHIPYRDSKLTRLLKGSLGGNHKTLMIACVSPSILSRDESMNTLRYANRAKNITNHAKVNVDPGSKAVTDLRNQVAALASELLHVITINNLEDNEYTCPFDMDYLENMINGTMTISKLHSERNYGLILPHRPRSSHHKKKTRSLVPPRPSSASLTDDDKKQRRRILSAGSGKEIDLDILQEIKEEENNTSQTSLLKNGESIVKNDSVINIPVKNVDNSLSKKELIMRGLDALMKTYEARRLENETQLQHISMKLDTLTEDKKGFESVCELFEEGSVNYLGMIESADVIQCKRDTLQKEKELISRHCDIANGKLKQISELVMKWQGFEHNRLRDSDVRSSSMVLEIIETYSKAIDTLLEWDNASTRNTRNDDVAQPSLPSEDFSVSKNKFEENVQPNSVPLESGLFVDENIDSNCDTQTARQSIAVERGLLQSDRKPSIHLSGSNRSLELSDVFSHLYQSNHSNQSLNYDNLQYLQSGESTLPSSFILSSSRMYPGHSFERRKWNQRSEKERLGDKLVSSSRHSLLENEERECADDAIMLTPDKCSRERSKSLARDTIYSCSNLSAISNLTPAEYLYKPPVHNDWLGLCKDVKSSASKASQERNKQEPSHGKNNSNIIDGKKNHRTSSLSTLSSNFSFTEHRESFHECEVANFLNTQKYHSDSCWSPNYFTNKKYHAVVISDEMNPDLLGSFVYTDSDPFDECEIQETNSQYSDNSNCFFIYLHRVVNKYFPRKEHSTTMQ